MFRSIVGLAAALTLATPAVAQDEPLGPVTELDAVEVQGRANTEEVVREFVAGVSAVHERQGQVATFDGRICPGVVNLPVEAAQVIADRIARAALIANLRVGQPGCEPNILVIATQDSDRVAPRLMDDNRREFAYHVSYQDRGPDLLAEFARPGRTVRWWHLTELDQFGRYAGSRLRAAHETDIFASIVMVDVDRTGPVTLNALGDYIALVALARMSPDADLSGLDSVLTLFDRPADDRPAAMTAWDQAYLEAVYSARGDAIVTRFQLEDIADRMLRRYQRATATEPQD